MAVAMNEHSRERNEGYTIHLLKQFFNIRRLKFPAMLGSFSWSSQVIKVKWLNAAHALNLGGGFVTPGDLARDYLAIKYSKRRIRCTTEQYQKCVIDHRAAPMLCLPCKLESATYFDLVGAYWQIVRAVGWDVSYNPEKWLGVCSSMIDFPYSANKMARNCLVSVGYPSVLRLWTGKEIAFSKRPSRFVNMILIRLAMDVLNGIAYDVKQAGAVYIYTDGYLVSDDKAQAVSDAISAWGVDFSIRHSGSAEVVAPTIYRIGDHSTRLFGRRERPVKSDKVYNPNNDWLRPRFAKYAALAKKAWLEWED